jgi:hypothetical protein
VSGDELLKKRTPQCWKSAVFCGEKLGVSHEQLGGHTLFVAFLKYVLVILANHRHQKFDKK